MKIFTPILILVLYSCGGGGSSMSSNSEVGAGSSGDYSSSSSYGSSSSSNQSSSSSPALVVSSATINGNELIQIMGANEEFNLGGNATSQKRTVYAYYRDDNTHPTYSGNAWPRVRFSGSDITKTDSVTAEVTKNTVVTDSDAGDAVLLNHRPTYQCSSDAYDYNASCEDSNWRLFLPNGSVNLEDTETVPEVAQTFVVTVENNGSGNKYYIDGELSPNLSLSAGLTYAFVQNDSFDTHPLRFSIMSDGIHASRPEFINGVKTSSSNKTIYIKVPVNIVDELYYFCLIHSGMANDAVISID